MYMGWLVVWLLLHFLIHSFAKFITPSYTHVCCVASNFIFIKSYHVYSCVFDMNLRDCRCVAGYEDKNVKKPIILLGSGASDDPVPLEDIKQWCPDNHLAYAYLRMVFSHVILKGEKSRDVKSWDVTMKYIVVNCLSSPSLSID